MRVLVVEDEALLSKQLATALGEAGYAVDCAEDGEKADFLGQTEGYDAVVLDLGLPKVDGLTLLRRWREQGIHVPVVVLTASCNEHPAVRAASCSCSMLRAPMPRGGKFTTRKKLVSSLAFSSRRK